MEPEVRIKALLQVLDNNPAVKFIAHRKRGLLVRFFVGSFPEPQSSRNEDDLERELMDLLEQDLDDPEEEAGSDYFESRAKRYLKSWVEDGFLNRNHDPRGLVVLEVSAAGMKAMDWLEKLQDRKFVGTDSKFRFIYDRIKTLAADANPDLNVRIAALERQRDELDEELRRLRGGEDIRQALREEELQAQVLELSQQARELVSDFREVERNFLRIAREIIQRRGSESTGKGDLLGHALDAVDALNESAQGRSFNAFWLFLNQPRLRGDWHQVLDQIRDAAVRLNTPIDLRTLRHIDETLLDAGSRINRANERLVERLRQLVADGQDGRHRQMMQLIQDVHRLTSRLTHERAASAIATLPSISIFESPSIHLLNERPLRLTERERVRNFAAPEDPGVPVEFSVAEVLMRGPQLPLLRELRAHAEQVLAEQADGVVTLSELMRLWIQNRGVTADEALAHCMAHFQLLREFPTTFDLETLEVVPLHGGRQLQTGRMFISQKQTDDA